MIYGGTTWELRNSVDSVESCALLAAEYEDVQYWTFEIENKRCHLKSSIDGDRTDDTLGLVSGSSECGNAHLYNYNSVGEYLRWVSFNSHYSFPNSADAEIPLWVPDSWALDS